MGICGAVTAALGGGGSAVATISRGGGAVEGSCSDEAVSSSGPCGKVSVQAAVAAITINARRKAHGPELQVYLRGLEGGAVTDIADGRQPGALRDCPQGGATGATITATARGGGLSGAHYS